MQERRHQNQNRPKITPIQFIQGMRLSRVIPNQVSAHQGHFSKNLFSDTAICIRLLGDRSPEGPIRQELGSGIFGYLRRKETSRTESPELRLEQRMDLSPNQERTKRTSSQISIFGHDLTVSICVPIEAHQKSTHSDEGWIISCLPQESGCSRVHLFCRVKGYFPLDIDGNRMTVQGLDKYGTENIY